MKFHRPHPLLTIAALLLMALTLKLAFWQFDRAEQKRALETAAAAAMNAAAITLTQPQAVQPFQRAALIGHYLPEAAILLENRMHRRQVGYHVLTPFALAGGGVAMVNRGWLAGDGSREPPPLPPPPAATITIQGVFYKDGSDAYRLSSAPEQGALRQHIDLAQVSEQSGLALMSLLLIKENAAGGLVAVSLRTDYKSAQSTVYAWQWLSFCLLTAIFYLLLTLKRQ